MNTLVLIGRPGAGKGTQASFIAKEFGWRHIGSGELLRGIRGSHSEFGARVRKDYDTGLMLPDWLVMSLLVNELGALPSSVGVVLDGFGRNKEQAREMHKIFAWFGRPYRVFELCISAEESMRRQPARALKEHRPDSDTSEKIVTRLKQQDNELPGARELFRTEGVLRQVDGAPPADVVSKNLRQALQREIL